MGARKLYMAYRIAAQEQIAGAKASQAGASSVKRRVLPMPRRLKTRLAMVPPRPSKALSPEL